MVAYGQTTVLMEQFPCCMTLAFKCVCLCVCFWDLKWSPGI